MLGDNILGLLKITHRLQINSFTSCISFILPTHEHMKLTLRVRHFQFFLGCREQMGGRKHFKNLLGWSQYGGGGVFAGVGGGGGARG